MHRPLRNTCVAAGICVIVLLQGCAAATVIREQPDFDDENKRRLQQEFRAKSVAAVGSVVPGSGRWF